jgi:hypothetical protein
VAVLPLSHPSDLETVLRNHDFVLIDTASHLSLALGPHLRYLGRHSTGSAKEEDLTFKEKASTIGRESLERCAEYSDLSSLWKTQEGTYVMSLLRSRYVGNPAGLSESANGLPEIREGWKQTAKDAKLAEQAKREAAR